MTTPPEAAAFLAKVFLGRASTLARRGRAIALLLLVPILVHLAEIAGFADCNPILEFSGFALGPMSQILPGRCWIDANVGGTTQALGHVVAESWLHLRLPWWNPYAGIGLPLAAEMQPAAFFLPFVLLLHFASGVLLMKMAMQMAGGLCMLACLRSLGIGRTVALCGAVLFELNGTFAWVGDAPMLPVAFLPLLVFGLERSRTLAQSGRRGGSIAIAGGLALSLVAGFPETAFIDGLLALVWCLVVVCGLEGRARLRFVGKVVVGGLAGLCLSAPAVAPFLDGLTQASMSVRGLTAFDWLMGGQWAALLLPTVFGPPFADHAFFQWGNAGGYIGVGVALPAIFALARLRDRRGLRLAIGAWIAFWLTVFLHLTPFFELWRLTPILNLVAVTRYAMPAVEFGCIILACMGLQDWRSGSRRRPAYVSGAVVLLCGAACVAAVLICRVDLHLGWPGVHFALPTTIWATALAMTLSIVLAGRSGRFSRVVAVTLVLADATISFVVPTLAGERPRRIDTAPIDFLRSNAGLARTYALTGILAPNYGSYFGIAAMVVSYEPMPLAWADRLGRLDPRLNGMFTFMPGLPPQDVTLINHLAAFQAAGVRFVMVPAREDPFGVMPGGGLRQVLRSPTAHIYELPNPAPYFSITSGRCLMNVFDRQTLQTWCDGPGGLTRLELAYPGWHASADGGELDITGTADGFQQIRLPSGVKRIRFDYEPPTWPVAATLCALGVVTIVAAAWRARAVA